MASRVETRFVAEDTAGDELVFRSPGAADNGVRDDVALIAEMPGSGTVYLTGEDVNELYNFLAEV